MQGFFSLSLLNQSARPQEGLLPKCGSCRLIKTCRSPKMAPTGNGRLGVMIVGEAPGEEEDNSGRQFVGRTGTLLRDVLKSIGVTMREDCILHNSLSCFTGDTRVESPTKIQVGYRRRYTGQLVRITTSQGRVLTGTPNHPILTSGGWVALGLLKQGDDLVCCGGGQGVHSGDTNVDDEPPQFHQLLQTLSEFGDVQRVVGSGVNFHGDGEHGDIDVVSQNRLLWNGSKSTVCQHSTQSPFVSPDELTSVLLRSGGGGNDSSVLIGGPFSAPRGRVGGGGQCLSALRTGEFHSQSHRLASTSKWNAGPLEDESDSVLTDFERVRDGLNRLSRTVTTDYIAKVEVLDARDQFFDGYDRSHGSAHVYNLQTEQGYYIANGIIVSNCRPPNNVIANKKAVDWCRPLVTKAIEEYQPRVIIPLGSTAIRSVLAPYWHDNKLGGAKRWSGYQIPLRSPNCWVCPTYHPSHIAREKKDFELYQMVFKKHLRAAFELKGRPWKDVPDYTSMVEVVLNPGTAGEVVARMAAVPGPVAIDFETDRLKPDAGGASVHCVALCAGDRALAFPVTGETKRALVKLIRSGKKFIAHNMKFEDRWCRKFFGARPRWAWDTMLNAHVLDARSRTTSLKFQAFVHFGQEDYDSHLDGLKRSREKGGNAQNRIKEVDLKQLLIYCGLDALHTYRLAMRQSHELGVKLC